MTSAFTKIVCTPRQWPNEMRVINETLTSFNCSMWGGTTNKTVADACLYDLPITTSGANIYRTALKKVAWRTVSLSVGWHPPTDVLHQFRQSPLLRTVTHHGTVCKEYFRCVKIGVTFSKDRTMNKTPEINFTAWNTTCKQIRLIYTLKYTNKRLSEACPTKNDGKMHIFYTPPPFLLVEIIINWVRKISEQGVTYSGHVPNGGSGLHIRSSQGRYFVMWIFVNRELSVYIQSRNTDPTDLKWRHGVCYSAT